MRNYAKGPLLGSFRAGAILAVLALWGACARAETTVSGPINSNTTWAAANSPYHMTGGVIVSNGVTLTIEAGVIVKIDPGRALQVDGTLIARGTSANPILFTKAGATEWGYILFADDSTDAGYDGQGNYVSGCIMEYCTVEYGGGAGVGNNAAIRMNSSSPYFNQCIVRNSKVAGANIYSSSSWNAGTAKFTSCTITSNGADGIWNGAFLSVSNSTVSANNGYGVYSYGSVSLGKCVIRDNISGGVSCSSPSNIVNSIIIGNAGGGVAFNGANSSLSGNIVADNNGDHGVNTFGDGNGVTSNAILRNRASNGSAISTAGNPPLYLQYNTITGNIATNTSNTATLYFGPNADCNYNNIFANTATYELWNNLSQGSGNQNATNNWWGTADDSQVQAKIFDWFDNSNYGIVNYAPFATAPRTDCPISPPTGLSATGSGGAIALSWSANPEPNVAGYKVYWDTQPTFPFANVIDVGNVPSYNLAVTPGTYYVALTAYNSGYAAANDDPTTIVNENQTNGNESWYTYGGSSVDARGPAPTISGVTPARGTKAGGTSVTINGTNFLATPTVTFGGVAATNVTFSSATQITCTTPAHAPASVNVGVTNPGGKNATQAGGFMYLDVPAITSSVTASGFVGQSFNCQITASYSPTSYNASGLPSWASVDTGSGAITGTPDATGDTDATISATNEAGTGTGPLRISIANPAPGNISLSPNSKTAGDAAFTLTVNGSNFVSNSVIRWGGTDKTTTFVSAAQLACPIAAADVATGGSVNVAVFSPTPGGGQSSPATFTINNPAPALTGISPTSTIAGGAGFALTLNGSNFVGSSVVQWSGQADLAPAAQNGSQITVNVPASYIAAAGTPSVSVFNRTPGGGTSLSQSFTINNPAPGITSLSPSSAIVGGASFTLTVNGSGFINGSAIWWGNSGKATTFVSASQLTAPIAAGDIGAVGTVNVTVVTPSPGGGTSGASTFSVNPPAPVITSATSASGTAGMAFSYQITASNSPTSYNAASLPSWASVDKGTGAIAGTPDATGPTNVTISATNVSGTGSATLQITIASAVPSITSPLTATGTAGQSFSYTITATGATPMTFSAQPLPDGLGLSGATISGTPTTAGQTNVTLGVSNSAGSDSKTLQITINPAGAPSITSALAVTGNVGRAFNYKITANGDAPLTFNAANLPAWMSFSVDTLSGTPAATGTTNVTISASNNIATDTKTLKITINASGAPTITSAPNADGKVNTAFSYTMAAAGVGTITFSANNMPGWMHVNGNALTGTPDTAGILNVQIVATNEFGTDTKTVKVTIYPDPRHPPGPPFMQVSRNPARTGVPVHFSAHTDSLYTPPLPLTYTWYFFLNEAQCDPPDPGQIDANGWSQLDHIFNQEGTYDVYAEANDGFDTSNRGEEVTVRLAPYAGSTERNAAHGKTVTNPINNLGITIPDSLGGVLDLDVGDNGVASHSVGGETFQTMVQGVGNGYPGQALAWKAQNASFFVIETTGTTASGFVRKARFMVPVSNREMGWDKAVSDTRSNKGIQLPALKGKFNFGPKPDSVSLTCAIELPAGMTFSSNLPISVGIGNVMGSGSVDSKGRVRGLKGDCLKKLQVKWPPLKKKNPITKEGDKAKITITMTRAGMDAEGFDTEGVVNTNITPKTDQPRKIQMAIVLDGVSYYTQAEANYVFKPNNKGGGTGTLMIQKSR